MVRVVVVGLGTMGAVHARSFAKMENADLIGVVDINESRADSFAKELDTLGFYSFTDAKQALGERIDVVSICLPTDLHPSSVKEAANIGADVICEKPLARTTKAAEEIVRYCKKKGARLFVGHVVRFFPEYRKAKEVVEAGRIGDVGVVRTTRGGAFPKASENWYADYDRSGGVVLDLLVHDFDFLRWTFGEVERIYAKNIGGVAGINEQAKEYALVSIRFKSGVIAHLEGSWAHKQFRTSFEFAGRDGILAYDSQSAQPLIAEKSDAGKAGGVAVPESPLKQSPYEQELRHFIACIEKNEQPLVTAEDAYRAVEIAEAALQSIKQDKPITLPLQTVLS
ncbi:Gfo/Idh/MocA family protein [Shouchella clausii]|uniref:Gfo/Idh/MocA family protein n=1 Tax=Shouchella clausii TaxID=79880 RepID=UPI002147CDB1|nr:Gfo/Idh/MocA family oxidoreductase [Shouchella clausii]MCR1287672.1 Gfo/Idh/MocA family oxidoreductase [Shouchella clausii]